MAREMERAGLHDAAADRRRDHQPGAHRGARSRRPTGGPVVHVLDASRAVGTVGRAAQPRDASRRSIAENRAEQERLRREHAARRVASGACSTLEEARRRRHADRLAGLRAAAARASSGVRVLERVPLGEIVPYIDWTPFFTVWELRGRFPRIFDDPEWGAGPRAVRRRAGAARAAIAERAAPARAVLRLLPGQRRGRRHRGLRRRRRVRVLTTLPHAAPAVGQRRRRADHALWPTSSRRGERAAPTTSAPSP